MSKLPTTVKNQKQLLLLTALLLLALTGVALASGGEGAHHADGGTLLKDFLYRCLSFAVVVGLLAYFTAKPIRNALFGRREGIEKALADAKAAQEDSEAKFAEYNRKLAAATEEIEEIYASIKREGEQEREKILANARETAKKIEEDAKKSADREIANAKLKLQREASALAIQLAEELLKKNFTSQDQSRLVDEYVRKVGELH